MHANVFASLKIAKLVVSGRKMTAFVSVFNKVVRTKMEANAISTMRLVFVNAMNLLSAVKFKLQLFLVQMLDSVILWFMIVKVANVFASLRPVKKENSGVRTTALVSVLLKSALQTNIGEDL